MYLSEIVYKYVSDLNVEIFSNIRFVDFAHRNLRIGFKNSSYHSIEVDSNWCSLWLCLPKGWYYDSTVHEDIYGLGDLDISKIKKAEAGEEYRDKTYCRRWRTFYGDETHFDVEELKNTINELVNFTRRALNLISFKTQLESEKELTGNL